MSLNEAVRTTRDEAREFLEKLQLVGDYVLTKTMTGPAEEMTDTGIVIARDTDTRNRADRGIVLKVGSESKFEVGQKLIFYRWAPAEIKVGEEKFLILSGKDVLGIYGTAEEAKDQESSPPAE